MSIFVRATVAMLRSNDIAAIDEATTSASPDVQQTPPKRQLVTTMRRQSTLQSIDSHSSDHLRRKKSLYAPTPSMGFLGVRKQSVFDPGLQRRATIKRRANDWQEMQARMAGMISCSIWARGTCE